VAKASVKLSKSGIGTPGSRPDSYTSTGRRAIRRATIKIVCFASAPDGGATKTQRDRDAGSLEPVQLSQGDVRFLRDRQTNEGFSVDWRLTSPAMCYPYRSHSSNIYNLNMIKFCRRVHPLIPP
jgi:hypothetical protein